MAFFDIVKEQQNVEEVKKIKLIGIEFLGKDIEIEANTQFIFNLIVSMSEEINDLPVSGIDIDLDTDGLVDELTKSKNIKGVNTKKAQEKALNEIKTSIKQQLKGKFSNPLNEIKNKSLEEDKVYEKYFFELPGVPTKEEFFKYLIESKGMKFTEDTYGMFSKMALMNKEPVDETGALMNVYEANLYMIRKSVEDTYGMSLNFLNKTKGEEVDSAF